jgi:hypothetical protein
MTVIQVAWQWTSFAQGLVLSPRTLPEHVVQAHLLAIQQSDFKSAFELCSPGLIEECPWSSFTDMISEPPFRPIVGHVKADVLMTIHDKGQESLLCFLVRVVPSKKVQRESIFKTQQPCLHYWWEISIQYHDGPLDGCWMIDSILPDFEDMEFDPLDLEMQEDDDGDDDFTDMYFVTGF